MNKIKLPSITTFNSKSKKESPWDKFWTWLSSQLPHNTKLGKVIYNSNIYGIPEGYNIDVTKVVLHTTMYQKISNLMLEWCIKVRKFSKKTAASEKGYYELCYAPVEHIPDESKPKSCKIDKEHVFVYDKYLIKNRN